MELIIKDINIKELKDYLAIFNALSLDSRPDGLNSYLLYRGEDSSLNLLLKNSLTFATIRLECTILNKENFSVDWGLYINNTMLSFIVNSYQEEQLSSMIWKIGEKETSYFKISAAGDNLSLPNMGITTSNIIELKDLILSEGVHEKQFSLSSLGNQKDDFLTGLGDCSNFLLEDEGKGNAIAIYKDRMVTSDRRQVFIYQMNEPVSCISEENPYFLHKRNQKIILTILKKNIEGQDISFSEDQKKLWIEAKNFFAVISNSLASIVPPSNEDLVKISPTERVATMSISTLLETAMFLQGFYLSGMDVHPIMIETIPGQGIKFVLQHTGVANQHSCNFERMISTDISNESIISIKILNDSLLKFLKISQGDENTTLFLDNDHIASLFETPKRKIFLAKLKG
jgi:hypothetical protein